MNSTDFSFQMLELGDGFWIGPGTVCYQGEQGLHTPVKGLKIVGNRQRPTVLVLEYATEKLIEGPQRPEAVR